LFRDSHAHNLANEEKQTTEDVDEDEPMAVHEEEEESPQQKRTSPRASRATT